MTLLLALLLSSRPVVGPFAAVQPPARERAALTSGLRYTLIPFGSISATRVELAISSGTLQERDDEAGLGELVGDYLLEGTRRHTAEQLARRMAELGPVRGEISVSVNASETVISAEVLSASAPELICLIAEVVSQPAFPPESLERVKAKALRRVADRMSQAPSIALARLDRLIFGQTAATRESSESVLREATVETVRRYWAEHYRPSIARLYVGGVFDREAVVTATRDAFSDWRSDQSGMNVTAPVTPASGDPVIHVIDRPGAMQSRIVVGFPVVDPAHPDYPILNEMNIVMGSMQTARIVANVRERHGYSYNIFSRLYGRPGSSKWVVAGDVATDVTDAALKEILSEIARLRTEPPSEDELRRFQRFLRGVLISELSTTEGILSTERWQEVQAIGNDEAFVNPRLESITPADLQRIAETYLTPERAGVVIVGDWKLIEPGLAKVGGAVLDRP